MVAEIALTQYTRDVYAPSDDSFALVDALAIAIRSQGASAFRRVLEVGSGSGYVITSIRHLLAQQGISSQCWATDLNPAAAACTQQTAVQHECRGVEVLCCSYVGPLLPRLRNCIDLLVFNPPYVPTPVEEVTQPGIARAWAGGHEGRQVIDAFLPQVPLLLSETGMLFLVTIAENRPQEILSSLSKLKMKGEVVLKRRADEEVLHILQCRWQHSSAQGDAATA